tara:strand:+ start:59563 stop:59754 length:192 start_codon:yes stop_codon:yes gene_type:complete
MKRMIITMILVTYATIITILYVGAFQEKLNEQARQNELIDQLLDCEAESARQFDEILRLESNG